MSHQVNLDRPPMAIAFSEGNTQERLLDAVHRVRQVADSLPLVLSTLPPTEIQRTILDVATTRLTQRERLQITQGLIDSFHERGDLGNQAELLILIHLLTTTDLGQPGVVRQELRIAGSMGAITPENASTLEASMALCVSPEKKVRDIQAIFADPETSTETKQRLLSEQFRDIPLDLRHAILLGLAQQITPANDGERQLQIRFIGALLHQIAPNFSYENRNEILAKLNCSTVQQGTYAKLMLLTVATTGAWIASFQTRGKTRSALMATALPPTLLLAASAFRLQKSAELYETLETKTKRTAKLVGNKTLEITGKVGNKTLEITGKVASFVNRHRSLFIKGLGIVTVGTMGYLMIKRFRTSAPLPVKPEEVAPVIIPSTPLQAPDTLLETPEDFDFSNLGSRLMQNVKGVFHRTFEFIDTMVKTEYQLPQPMNATKRFFAGFEQWVQQGVEAVAREEAERFK